MKIISSLFLLALLSLPTITFCPIPDDGGCGVYYQPQPRVDTAEVRTGCLAVVIAQSKKVQIEQEKQKQIDQSQQQTQKAQN